MADPFVDNLRYTDCSARVQQTTTIIASPSTNAEVVVATTPAFDGTLPIAIGALLMAEIAYTIGTSGASCQLRIRRGTTTSGAVVYNTGAQTGGHSTAGQLVADSGGTFDTGAGSAQQYSVTLQIGSGAGASTVSAVSLVAVLF